jgi:hypothetical protein
MEWVASTLHTTSEHGVSNITTITTADAHTSAASSRPNGRPRRFKWTRPFRRKTKYGFCACAITFQTQPNCLVSRVSGENTKYISIPLDNGHGNYGHLTPCSRILEKFLILCRNCPHFMAPESPSPRSQVPAICPYPEPDPYSPGLPILFFQYLF